MGSNLRAIVVAGFGTAILVGMTPTALANNQLRDALGHIDIPEIAGTGHGPKIPGIIDGFDFGVDPEMRGTMSIDDFLLRRDWESLQTAAFHPSFGAPGTSSLVTDGVSAVPTPGAVGLGLVGAGLLGFRRRRD